MPFSFESTGMEGLTLIHPHIAEDHRGAYCKYFEREVFAANGLPTDFGESSEIQSHKGVLRGLHFQGQPSQGKLIHVVRGAIYDVAVDLRQSSPTFGCWKSFELSADDERLLYIPEHFAHGFLALEEDTLFSYQCTGKYVPEACGGIRWDDPELNIPWPAELVHTVILSEKDRSLPYFKQLTEK